MCKLVFTMLNIKSDVFRRANFLLTALGLRKKGFYTPYNYLNMVPATSAPYPEVFDHLDRFRSSYETILAILGSHEAYYLNTHKGAITPNWHSDYLSPLDAAGIYSFVAHYKPSRIIEIGSGNSTFFMARAVADHGLDTRITCIDPQPRVAISSLPVDIQRRALSIADIAQLSRLAAGDFLFVDSSHYLQPNFDVDIIFNRVLPRLKPGVIVHFHDIFLPFGYPSSWHHHRFNEQIGLIGWLLTGKLEPIFASHYIWREMQPQLTGACKSFAINTPANGGSLWVRVK